MFTWLNKQGVRSNEGFEVQFTGRFDAEYREGKNLVKLEIESGSEGNLPCIILDPAAFSYWQDGTRIPEAEQVRLFRNFEAAMEFQGLKMLIQKGE